MAKSIILRLSFSLLMLGITQLPVLAQGPGNGGPRPGAVTDVPVDGGASLLLAGGLALGLRRLRRR
ncbi:PID-CTERM protein-sorting domain-containing protein [Hymenobacter persicinus]|uniref:Uncharacterized protein n=1 Tax=Hymenobacter persicinus TaxID=2025506 RepID=A0A4Q5LBB2_9BACT|nr:hypothetical protein [Hymenobacter persicinus]RYU76402.1 hypothetical protein EWM57_18685 [Hymenobacter persicinus]